MLIYNKIFQVDGDAENSALPHRWYLEQGSLLENGPGKMFEDKAAGFSTLMEVTE